MSEADRKQERVPLPAPRAKPAPPHYELRSVDSDGNAGEPELVPVTNVPWDAHSNRRGFLGAGMAASAALLALAGCTKPKKPIPLATTTAPPPTPPPTTSPPTTPPTTAPPTTSPPATSPPPTSPPATSPPSGGEVPPGYTCTCNKVCTCIPVCQAHRLLDDDPVIRRMAEQVLLCMGAAEFDYMRWAAFTADSELRGGIFGVMAAIEAGAQPDPRHWPSPTECALYIAHHDAVTSFMAAQMVQQWHLHGRGEIDPRQCRRVNERLARAPRLGWLHRSR